MPTPARLALAGELAPLLGTDSTVLAWKLGTGTFSWKKNIYHVMYILSKSCWYIHLYVQFLQIYVIWAYSHSVVA